MLTCNCAVQMWLQDFAWTVDDLPDKYEGRKAKMLNQPALSQEPMFCFELAIRLFYWSCLVYEIGEVNQRPSIARHSHAP